MLKNRTTAVNVEKHPQDQLLQKVASSLDTVKSHITIQELQVILYRCKQLVLTPMQINILIGYSNAGPSGIVDVSKFNPVCCQVILDMFSIEPVRRKAQML